MERQDKYNFLFPDEDYTLGSIISYEAKQLEFVEFIGIEHLLEEGLHIKIKCDESHDEGVVLKNILLNALKNVNTISASLN